MTISSHNKLSYRDAGVDIDAGHALVTAIKPFVQSTARAEVLGGIGGFGALFALNQKWQDPVLVSSTDGVGTKLKLACALNRHNTIGIDLVAMSVNDILVQGAEPLFFLDYFSCGKLDIPSATAVVEGIATGCKLAGCALIGGETAEMPGMYHNNEYDLAGFAVGVVERSKLIDGTQISPGDIVLGLAASGLHANGYALVRKILETVKPDLAADFHGQALAEVLLKPTRIYVKPLLSLMAKIEIKGLAHITGGGLIENLPRVLHKHLTAVLHRDAWTMPPLFAWLQRQGQLEDREMYRVFNCGIGMTVIVSQDDADAAIAYLHACGETVQRIGVIRQRLAHEAQVIMT